PMVLEPTSSPRIRATEAPRIADWGSLSIRHWPVVISRRHAGLYVCPQLRLGCWHGGRRPTPRSIFAPDACAVSSRGEAPLVHEPDRHLRHSGALLLRRAGTGGDADLGIAGLYPGAHRGFVDAVVSASRAGRGGGCPAPARGDLRHCVLLL